MTNFDLKGKVAAREKLWRILAAVAGGDGSCRLHAFFQGRAKCVDRNPCPNGRVLDHEQFRNQGFKPQRVQGSPKAAFVPPRSAVQGPGWIGGKETQRVAQNGIGLPLGHRPKQYAEPMSCRADDQTDVCLGPTVFFPDVVPGLTASPPEGEYGGVPFCIYSSLGILHGSGDNGGSETLDGRGIGLPHRLKVCAGIGADVAGEFLKMENVSTRVGAEAGLAKDIRGWPTVGHCGEDAL
jgi:hypothetical protein